MRAKEIFEKEYGGGRNFMTPKIQSRGMISPTRAYEVSEGTGIEGGTLFGVTVVDYDPQTGKTERQTKLSGCCRSLEAARDYVRFLKSGGASSPEGTRRKTMKVNDLQTFAKMRG